MRLMSRNNISKLRQGDRYFWKDVAKNLENQNF